LPTTVAALQVAVGADISGAEKGLSTLNKRLGTLPGFFGNAASSALGFGAATLGLNALGGVGDLVHEALGVGLASDLEGLTAQFTAFTGSSEQAQGILAQVRKEADITPFGFQEMAQAAAALLPAAKQSGTALMDLIHPAEILAALNPAQGLSGASFALREALSGDWQSLTDRFNISREALARFKGEAADPKKLREAGDRVTDLQAHLDKLNATPRGGTKVARLGHEQEVAKATRELAQAQGDLAKLQGSTGLPALEAINAVLKEQGADMGLVALQSQTTAGRLSTFQDLISGIEIQAGKPILAALGGELDRFSGIITSGQGGLEGFATSLGTAIAGGIHTAGQELGTFLVTMQNISAEHGVDTLTAAFVALELRIGEVFGPQAQGDAHTFLTAIKDDGQWLVDNSPKMLGTLGDDLHIAVTWADNLTRALNDIDAAGTKVRETIATILGVQGQPTIANRIATGGGIGLGAPGGPGATVVGEPINVPGVPGNLFPGGPIFAGPAAGDTHITVTVTGNNIDNQVDMDAMAQQLAAAVEAGQRSAANAPPNTLVGAA
jgi:hypothetical protein